MKLAYFSPLPPLPSSIADYSGDLVPFLARHAELDLFIDDGYEPAGHLRGSLPIHDYRTFPDLVNRRRYDICLYQMGNDARYHEYIYSMLLEHPGVVVLHQYVLHDLILGMTVQCGDRDRFIEEMRYCYGESGVYRAHLATTLSMPVDKYAFPLFERVVDAAQGVIVHSEEARERVLLSRPDARVVRLNYPLFLDELSRVAQGSSAERLALGFPEDAFVVGSFDSMTAPSRPEAALRAFRRFRRRFPRAVYLVVGEAASTSVHELLTDEPELAEGVLAMGHVDASMSVRYMATVDAALSLCLPTGGEASHGTIRLMGLGKVVCVPNEGSSSEMPDDCCIKIDVREGEEEAIWAALSALAENQALRSRIGANGRRYVQTYHTFEAAGQGYIDFIRSVVTSASGPVQVSPPLAAPAEGDAVSPLVSEVSSALLDLGVDESDEALLMEIARSLCDIGIEPSSAM